MESEYSYKNTGKLAINLRSNEKCIILKENLITGQIQTLERIEPLVINTPDSWLTLELVDNK